MSRKKKQNKTRVPPMTQQNWQGSKQSEATKGPWWRPFQWWNLANTVLAGFALLGTAVSVYWYREQAQAAREATQVAKEANARASGKLSAALELVDSIPNTETLPPEKRKSIFGT